MNASKHPLSQQELMAFVDGQLHRTQMAEISEHMKSCSECTAVIEDAKQVSTYLAAWKVEDAPARLTRSVGVSAQQVAPKVSWWSRPRIWVYAGGGSVAVALLLLLVVMPSLLRSRQAAVESNALRPVSEQDQTLYYERRALPQQGQQGQQSQQESYGSLALTVPQAAAPVPAPMIIRVAKLSIVTKEFDAARSNIDTLVQRLQGYLDHLTVTGEAGSARRLTATLRVPSNQLDPGLTELKKLGRVVEETQNSTDVTSQYVDLNARLANARNSEQRLLALLRDRTGKLSDVVEVEREISTVRENIERMEAQQKDLNNKVQYSSIQLELAEEYHAQLETPQPTTRTQVHNAFVDGVRSGGETVLAIVVYALRYGPAILIWFGVAALLGLIVWRVKARHGAALLGRMSFPS